MPGPSLSTPSAMPANVRLWQSMRMPKLPAALVATLIVAAAAAGVVLRFVSVSPLWLDEALSVHIADGDTPLSEALRRDGHPGLYYLLLRGWIGLLGPSELAVRALSGIFSLAAVPFVVLAARRCSPQPAVAAAAAVLALTSPYLMRYGSEARMYAMLAALVAFGWWALERALERPTAVRLAVLAAAAGALAHTHYWAVFVVAAVLVLLAQQALVSPDRRRTALRVGAAVLAGCATMVLWLGVLIDQATRTGTPWAKPARPTEVFVETAQAIGANSRFEGETYGVWLLALAALGVLAAGRADGSVLRLDFGLRVRRQAVGAVLAGTLVLGAAAALATASGFEARYAGVVVPLVIVLAARGVTCLPARTAPVLLCLLAVFGAAVGIDEARRDRTQGREAAEAINDEAAPGDVVVLCPDQIGPATVHYIDADVTTIAYPRGGGRLVDWRDYLETIAARDPLSFAHSVEELAGAADVWLVLGDDYRGFGDRCTTLAREFGRRRVAAEVVAEREELFEPMTLIRYSRP